MSMLMKFEILMKMLEKGEMKCQVLILDCMIRNIKESEIIDDIVYEMNILDDVIDYIYEIEEHFSEIVTNVKKLL